MHKSAIKYCLIYANIKKMNKNMSISKKWAHVLCITTCLTLYTAPYQDIAAQSNQNAQGSQQNAAQQLSQILAQHTSFRADFTQTQEKQQAKTQKINIKSKQGSLQFLAPNRFILNYAFPNAQRIQSDGKKVYIYQADLKQLIEKDAAKVLDQSPLMSLFQQKIDQQFDVRYTSPKTNQGEAWQWFELLDKKSQNIYQNIYIAFDAGKPAYIEFTTSLGKTTFTWQNFQAIKATANDFIWKGVPE